MGGYTWFTGDGPPDPPEQQEGEHVNEPKNSCGEPARQGQFGPLDEARLQLAAKDREIAELRRRRAEMSGRYQDALGEVQLQLSLRGQVEFERDEARECVGRLYGALRELRDVQDYDWQLYVDGALAATPEHLRNIPRTE